jgi:hypothetical protein
MNDAGSGEPRLPSRRGGQAISETLAGSREPGCGRALIAGPLVDVAVRHGDVDAVHVAVALGQVLGDGH